MHTCRATWEMRREAMLHVEHGRLVCEKGEKVSQCDSSHTEHKYTSSTDIHTMVLRLKHLYICY